MKMQTACLTQDWPLKRNTVCGLKTWFPNTGSPRSNWRGLSNDTFGSVAFREWGLFAYLFFFRRTLQTVSCCNLGKHLLAAGVCGISCSDGEVPVSPPFCRVSWGPPSPLQLLSRCPLLVTTLVIIVRSSWFQCVWCECAEHLLAPPRQKQGGARRWPCTHLHELGCPDTLWE